MKMRLAWLWFISVTVFWIIHLSNALPAKKMMRLTKIGDLSAKDIVKIADETTPTKKHFEDQEAIQQDNESERDEYYHANGNINLETPLETQEKFVHMLGNRYGGLFPEYGKETKADFAKNRELEENLEAQPETEMLENAHGYGTKNRQGGDLTEDEEPQVDNLDNFDSDEEVMNPENGEESVMKNFHERIEEGKAKGPRHATEDEQGQKVDENELQQLQKQHETELEELQKQHESELQELLKQEQQGQQEQQQSAFEELSDQTLNDNNQNDDNSDQDNLVSSSGTRGTYQDNNAHNSELNQDELETSGGNAGEELLENSAASVEGDDKLNDILQDGSSPGVHDTKNPTVNGKQNAKAYQIKGKLLSSDNVKGIMKEFDELKAGLSSKRPMEKHGSAKVITQKKRARPKKIQYIHAKDNHETGDAILDFLDNLLEKDPKKLRHDVLAMANEMKEEELGSSKSGKIPASTKGGSTGPGIIHEGALDGIDESKEVDEWISDMEKGKASTTSSTIITGHHNELKNEDYKPYQDALSSSSDIYPDHNHGGGGGEVNNLQSNGDGDSSDAYKELHDQQNQEIYPDGKSSGSGGSGVSKGSGINAGGTGHEAPDKKKKEQKEQEYFDYEEFKEEALKMHNEFRVRHNAIALRWSDKLAKKAKDRAEQLIEATRTSFKRELEKNGQSIAILPYLTKNIAKTAIEKWYSEITKFSFSSLELKPETRDFTQIIWRGSKEMGMGFGYSPDNKRTVVVAMYSPAGNKEGHMRDNLNMASHDPYADIRKGKIEKHS